MDYIADDARGVMNIQAEKCRTPYFDALVQMGILEVTERGDDVWVVLKPHLSELFERARGCGFLVEPEEGTSSVAVVACALAVTALQERGVAFNREDLLGIASVLDEVLTSVLDDPQSQLSRDLEALAQVGRRSR